MNHFSLLAHLYVLSTQAPQNIQNPPKKINPLHQQQICLKDKTCYRASNNTQLPKTQT
jgi:hypothetical protein